MNTVRTDNSRARLHPLQCQPGNDGCGDCVHAEQELT
jgi:hypothetical protein